VNTPNRPPTQTRGEDGAARWAYDCLSAADEPAGLAPLWLPELPGFGAPLVEWAIVYARAGLEIMPRRPGAGGRLIDALTGTPRTGLIGEAEVAGWWVAHPATPALAVVCGFTSGVLVIDVDQHAGQVDGLAALRDLERQHEPLAAPPVALTPSGAGRHIYFRWPRAPVRFGRIAPGIECVACATLPPSRKRAGVYRWSLSRHPAYLPLPPVPAWLLAMLKPPPPPRPRRHGELGNVESYAAAALKRELDAVAKATDGERNERLFTAAWNLSRLVGRGFSARDLERELVAMGEKLDLGEREARGAFRSAMRRRAAR
jgi:hypothetical protein